MSESGKLYDKLEHANESFKQGQKFVANIQVVNDAAERTVKLYSDYAAILTEIKSNELVCCRSLKNIENKLATLKNGLRLLNCNSQPRHLQTFPIKSNTSLVKVPVV